MSITVRAPQAKPATTLYNCENEPVRTPGCVQGFAALFIADATDGRILQFSSNAVSVLSLSPLARVLDRAPADVLEAHWTEACERAFAAARQSALSSDRFAECAVVAGGAGKLLRFYVRPGRVVLECEPEPPQARGDTRTEGWAHAPSDVPSDVPSNVRSVDHEGRSALDAFEATEDLLSRGDITPLCDAFCAAFRASTGYARVLIYKFDENWNGQVVGESHGAALTSLQGHWFPASDIPANVRALYLESPLRVVADVHAPQAKLVPEQDLRARSGADLVGCVSRGVSGLHLEYMRNMGLSASCSVALLVDGVLWGIVSAHHTTPFLPTPSAREGMQRAAQRLGAALGVLAARARAETTRVSEAALAALTRVVASPPSGEGAPPLRAGDEFYQHLATLLALDGLVLLNTHTGARAVFGAVPEASDFARLAAGIRASTPARLFVTDSLAQWFGQGLFGDQGASTSAGCLRFAFGREAALEAFCFRDRVTSHLDWGGNPFERAGFQAGRIHPRRSFETFRQVVTLQSRAWSADTIEVSKQVSALLEAHPAFVDALLTRVPRSSRA